MLHLKSTEPRTPPATTLWPAQQQISPVRDRLAKAHHDRRQSGGTCGRAVRWRHVVNSSLNKQPFVPSILLSARAASAAPRVRGFSAIASRLAQRRLVRVRSLVVDLLVLVLVPRACTRGERLFCPPTAYRLPLTIPNITGCVEDPCRANVRVVEASLRKSPTALPAIIPGRPECLSSPAPSPIAYTLCVSLSLGLLLSDYSSLYPTHSFIVACGGPPHPHCPRTHTTRCTARELS
jgi:hypothetical protein